MKPENQIKALAELDGWKPYLYYCAGYENLAFQKGSEQRTINGLLYLISYDAIIPLIQKQKYSVVAFIHDELCNMNDTKYFLGSATPAQLCEALLRATNKWNED